MTLEVRLFMVHIYIEIKEDEFLHTNIHKYGGYLRKSALAVLDLNFKYPSTKVVMSTLDKEIFDKDCYYLCSSFIRRPVGKTSLEPDLRKEIRKSLNILALAR